MRYLIAYNGNGIVHHVKIDSNQSFSTGQPNVEEFDTEKEWLNRLGEFGIDPNAESDSRNYNIDPIEKWKLEIILEEGELLETINQVVSQADNRTQKAWEKSPTVNRYSNALESIRKVLELSHEQVDDIFKRANEIEI